MEPTIKTTEKVVNIKAQKEAKPKAAPKKAGRPRNVQEFTATEMKQVASKLRPVQKLFKEKLGVELTLLQTVDFVIHNSMPDDD